MSSDVRDRMIAGAARLLAQHGLQATSFSTVLAEAGAPRGSIYHHFPAGKDELVIAAIGATEQHVVGLLDFPPGTTVRQVVESFLGAWRLLLTAADFHAGCALVAVTVAAETDEVRERAAQAFGTWRTALANALHEAGLDAAVAKTTGRAAAGRVRGRGGDEPSRTRSRPVRHGRGERACLHRPAGAQGHSPVLSESRGQRDCVTVRDAPGHSADVTLPTLARRRTREVAHRTFPPKQGCRRWRPGNCSFRGSSSRWPGTG